MAWCRRFVAVLMAAWAITVCAVEPVRDPLSYPLRQYALMLGTAILGGVVSWIAKVRAGTIEAWRLSHLIGEIATSAFAGLLAFWMCEYASTPPVLEAALVGVAGHMGTRAITAFEEFAMRRWGSKT